jgi:hypothetical protein
MASPATLTDPTQQPQQGIPPEPSLPGQPVGDEATSEDQSTQATEDGNLQAIDPQLSKLALEIRRRYKLSWSAKRRFLIQRVLKAFEFLKGNPYSLWQRDSFSYDPLFAVLSGQREADDMEFYAHNDNIFQMLCLSYIAVASNNTDKTRFLPVNPQDEKDSQFADRASLMMADIERRNNSSAMQKLEALYHFCAGSYFSYCRNIVDKRRAGYSTQPVYGMQIVKLPNRFICPQCADVTPEQHVSPFENVRCPGCKTPLTPSNWWPEEEMQAPSIVDTQQIPNAMTAIDIFCLLNVDADPNANSLEESPILDLEGELTAAAVRSNYPQMYQKVQPGAFSTGNPEDESARIARDNLTSPGGRLQSLSLDQRGTYSRCWIQPWAYALLDNQADAEALKAKFPNGLKLVTWGPELVLEMVEEDMMEKWTWCPIVKGMGLFPFAIGDSSVSVQERINDCANNVHAYMDRLAFPHVLYDVDQISGVAMNQNAQGGAQMIGVKRVKLGNGARDALSSALFQPQYHIDSGIYSYSQQLVQLAQLLSGIQPQVFGAGTTSGVETMGGQQQQLNTAMGRLMLFFQQQKEEHAARARNAVKCMAKLVDGQMRVRVPSEIEGEEQNEYILETEVQGEIDTYPEDDDGFPASYAEIRDRLMQLAQNLKNIPFLAELLEDPDNGAIFAKYLLPPGIEVPGAAARVKIKTVLSQLVESPIGPTSQVVNGNVVVMPSIKPDQDFDDFSMITQIATQWAQQNFQLQATNPKGFENVRAYFRLASQYQAQKAMQYSGQLQGAVAGGAPSAPNQGPSAPSGGPSAPNAGPGAPMQQAA